MGEGTEGGPRCELRRLAAERGANKVSGTRPREMISSSDGQYPGERPCQGTFSSRLRTLQGRTWCTCPSSHAQYAAISVEKACTRDLGTRSAAVAPSKYLSAGMCRYMLLVPRPRRAALGRKEPELRFVGDGITCLSFTFLPRPAASNCLLRPIVHGRKRPRWTLAVPAVEPPTCPQGDIGACKLSRAQPPEGPSRNLLSAAMP